MELQREVTVAASASAAWRVIGEQFGEIGTWASPIVRSTLDGPPRVGAERTCHTARFGPVPAGTIIERLIAFDPDAMTLSYEAAGGMPSFVARAVNRWSVHPVDEGRARIRTRATLELRGPLRLVSPLIAWRLRADGARVLDELAHRIETGATHPRKLAAPR